MKVTGIIAEYNPFHNGHKYQIETLRKCHATDYVVVAMSGDFVQRGAPALMRKYERAKMALMQGADLVFELPSCFSTSSAKDFATGGILLFHTTGLVDSVCFGTETEDFSRLRTLADLLADEPDWYQNRLSALLKQGFSFPAARAQALPEYEDLLKTPNNILAIEYLCAIKQLHSEMTPLPIKRIGSGYHDTSLSEDYASASAIRKSILSFQNLPSEQKKSRSLSTELSSVLSPESLRIMSEYQKDSAFLFENDFSLLLHHQLLSETGDSLLSYSDMTKALANRIINAKDKFLSWSSFCELLKTRETTYTRISRTLSHILLQQKSELTSSYTSLQSTTLPYLRILGFSEHAKPLLNELKRTAKAPLLTSLASASKVLDTSGLQMLQSDIFSSDLYRSVLQYRTNALHVNEYRRKLLMIDNENSCR